MVRVNLIQTVRIWVLLRALREAVVRIQKITNSQASPTLLLSLLLNGKAYGMKYGKKRGAKPKDPYAYQKLPQDDKDIPMPEFPRK